MANVSVCAGQVNIYDDCLISVIEMKALLSYQVAFIKEATCTDWRWGSTMYFVVATRDFYMY